MKILFVGDLNKHTRSFQRSGALKNLGHELILHSFVRIPWEAGRDTPSPPEKILYKIGIPRDKVGINEKIKQSVRSYGFDIIWLEKGNVYKPSTLKFVKKIQPDVKLVSCSEDNMALPHNNSFYFRRGISQYDIVFSTKRDYMDSLQKMGARRVELFLDAYDRELHRPIELSSNDRKKYACDVGFVGTFEKDRFEDVLYLVKNGIKVIVWGNGWEDCEGTDPNLVIKKSPLYGEEYVKAINATKINLCFLRKINRDKVTSRSVEIPACGGFMIGERTVRHWELFEEGKEAEFFESKEELLEKVKYFLENEKKRERIAKAGRDRCLSSSYSHEEQLRIMVKKIKNTTHE